MTEARITMASSSQQRAEIEAYHGRSSLILRRPIAYPVSCMRSSEVIACASWDAWDDPYKNGSRHAVGDPQRESAQHAASTRRSSAGVSAARRWHARMLFPRQRVSPEPLTRSE